jgi:hypothetical protein
MFVKLTTRVVHSGSVSPFQVQEPVILAALLSWKEIDSVEIA